MGTTESNRQFVDPWAYDIDKKVLKGGEVWDVNVLHQSIEMILGTLYGERLFNPTFGSNLQLKIFDIIDESSGDNLLEDVAGALKKWEDRILVIESEMRLNINEDNHTMVITIPFIVKGRNIKSIFKKKIIL